MSGIGKANLRGAAAKTDKRPLLLLLVRSKVILEFNFILVAFLAVASLRLRGSAEKDSQTVICHACTGKVCRLIDSETVNNFQNLTSFKVRVQCDSVCMPPPST